MPQGFSIDRVLSAAFGAWKEHLGRLLWTAAVVFIGALLAAVVVVGTLTGIGAAAGSVPAGLIVGVLIAAVVAAFASVAYTASVMKVVESRRKGEAPGPFNEVIAQVRPRLWSLIWVSLTVGLITLLAAAIPVGIGLGFGALAGASAGSLIGGGVLGGVVGLVAYVFLAVIWVLVGPVVLFESKGLDALARSRELVKGNGWSVLAVGLVVVAINVGTTIVQSTVQAIAGVNIGGVVGLVFFVLLIPVSALVHGSLYFELLDASSPDPGPGLPQQSDPDGAGPITFG